MILRLPVLRSVPPLAAVVLIVLYGCLGAASTDDDSSEATASEPTPCRDEPAHPSDPCLAGCGNELFVGMACTREGGECSDHQWPEARLCTADHDDGGLAFCTRPCVVDEDCGTGAMCVGEPGHPERGQGCFPIACWDDLWPVRGIVPPTVEHITSGP